MSWYIDSWAVLDGLAFASLREPDTIKADATVFLSVPDLEPVPVGRISTALRAQRNCFQDRFCDENGNEFPFENLAQIQETIRRGYLSGGLASAPIPLNERPIDPLLFDQTLELPNASPQMAGGAYYQDSLDELERRKSIARIQIDYSFLQDPIQRRKTFEKLHEKATFELYECARAFGEATLLEFLSVRWSELYKPEVREQLSQWIYLLYTVGLWSSPKQFAQFLNSAKLTHRIFEELLPQLDLRSGPTGNGIALPLGKDSVFQIPCPLLEGWNKHIKSLHHKLLLPLVDRSYFESNRNLEEFIPLLFCSLILAVGPSLGARPSLFQMNDRQRLMGRALFWINRELPHVELPEGVEIALTKFAWEQLRKSSSTGEAGPAPTTFRPQGNPPLDPSGSTAVPVPRYAPQYEFRSRQHERLEPQKSRSRT